MLDDYSQPELQGDETCACVEIYGTTCGRADWRLLYSPLQGLSEDHFDSETQWQKKHGGRATTVRAQANNIYVMPSSSSEHKSASASSPSRGAVRHESHSLTASWCSGRLDLTRGGTGGGGHD
eukprot:1884782-Amphidinium_carterae.2